VSRLHLENVSAFEQSTGLLTGRDQLAQLRYFSPCPGGGPPTVVLSSLKSLIEIVNLIAIDAGSQSQFPKRGIVKSAQEDAVRGCENPDLDYAPLARWIRNARRNRGGLLSGLTGAPTWRLWPGTVRQSGSRVGLRSTEQSSRLLFSCCRSATGEAARSLKLDNHHDQRKVSATCGWIRFCFKPGIDHRLRQPASRLEGPAPNRSEGRPVAACCSCETANR